MHARLPQACNAVDWGRQAGSCCIECRGATVRCNDESRGRAAAGQRGQIFRMHFRILNRSRADKVRLGVAWSQVHFAEHQYTCKAANRVLCAGSNA